VPAALMSDAAPGTFRAYLILLGRIPYETALRDPDAIAPVVPDAETGDLENADDIAPDAYDEVTGEDIPSGDSECPARRGTTTSKKSLSTATRTLRRASADRSRSRLATSTTPIGPRARGRHDRRVESRGREPDPPGAERSGTPRTLIALAWATLTAPRCRLSDSDDAFVHARCVQEETVRARQTRGRNGYRERGLRVEVERRFERPVIAVEPARSS
jgi:hypothetical protein